MSQTVAITGGSGFVGQVVARSLLSAHFRPRIISRREYKPEDEWDDYLDHIEWTRCDPYDKDDLARALHGCSAVVNLIGILNARLFTPGDFRRVHVYGVENTIAACRQAGVGRLLHVSALNANPAAPSEYLRTKGEGENLVHAADDLKPTSFRPSVIFGSGDSFLNRFVPLVRMAPGIFPLACADSVFAPVFVGDVADRIADAAGRPETAGQRINLCGPERWTLREIVEYIARLCGKRLHIVGLPNAVARLQAQVCEFIPGKPFSVDNYLSLQLDSVCNENDTLCTTVLTDVAPRYVPEQT